MSGEVIGAIGGILGSVLSFSAFRSLRSGRVATTDADTLWKQSQDLIDRLLNRVEVLELAMAGLRREVADKDGRIEALSNELIALRVELIQRDERIAHLEHERDRLADRVDELEREQVLRRAERPT